MTMKLYVVPSSTSSRKMKAFLEDKKIKYVEQNMLHDPLSKEQLFEILAHSEDGVEDVLSTNSKDYKMLTGKGVDFDELTLTKLHSIVEDYPKLLKTPIIIHKNRTMVGFNEDVVSILEDRASKKDIYRKVLNMIRLRENEELAKTGFLSPAGHQAGTVW